MTKETEYVVFSGKAVWCNTHRPRRTKTGQSYYSVEFEVTEETIAEMEAYGIPVAKIRANGNNAFFQRKGATPPRLAIATPERDKTFTDYIGPGSAISVKVSLQDFGQDTPYVTFVSLRVDELVPYVTAANAVW